LSRPVGKLLDPLIHWYTRQVITQDTEIMRVQQQCLTRGNQPVRFTSTQADLLHKDIELYRRWLVDGAVGDRPTDAIRVVACVVVAEGTNWLSHWVKHVQPWWWRFHLQHHMGRHDDTTLTLHTHPVDVIVIVSGAGMSAVLLVLGFQPLAVVVFVVACYVARYVARYSVLTVYDVVFGTAVWPSADIHQQPVGVVDVSERDFVTEMLLLVRGASDVKK
jgi:Fatty acid hydroxylase superfamily